MRRKGGGKGVVFEVGVKGEGEGLGLGFFVKWRGGEVAWPTMGDRRDVLSGLKYFEGDILVEGCRM